MVRNTLPIPGTPFVIVHQDELNWALQETKVIQKGDNKGKETASSLSHHATLGQALRAAAFLVTDDEVHADIDSYIERLNTVEQKLRDIGQ